jgi:uncharacterized protein (DUF697 family)
MSETTELSQKELAGKLTGRFVLWSMGGSLIPIPFIDLATVIGVQIKLISEMSKIYEVPFEKNRIKGIVAPLIGSIGIAPAGTMFFGSLTKFIPGIGHLVSALSFPVVIGAITYATGRVFISHFESGGTLLNFNTEEAKESFKEHFEEGKTVAKEMKESEGAAKGVAPKK